ncbi:aldehyde dehydrogenase family protein [Gordonia sp. NB41Y]|uniref:aldehyde dehydrogenase family protein n=1 Tax=Gordonia sp. NB41Y TaxID=875808 RepID=UPI0002BDC278|nr:aldehyde dehydrogenase family protein [Gordonia sp. NB41Y]WLP88681.1 aldehyde dehydrogenase family protein [Gordonia sp. NB41Y]
MTTTATPTPDLQAITATDLEDLVRRQRAAFRAEGIASAETRIGRIDRLLLAVVKHSADLAASLDSEYGSRPPALTKALDVLPSVGAAAELREGIEEWMKPEVVAGGYVQKRPLGVVGVVGAWNFPLELTIHPAIDALAAGNRVIIKFPDFHPRTGAILAAAVAEYLPPEEVAVVVGDLETAQRFSELDLDHLIFTGSPAVGRKVAEAAARNLVPTTLELGGKNPVVISPSADLDLAAHRVAGTRLLNAGQVCLCPDYVFVTSALKGAFLEKLAAEIRAVSPRPASAAGVVSIVNERNHSRVLRLVEDALSKGAERVDLTDPGTDVGSSTTSRRIDPTILRRVPADALIADEEIFGPVLPVYTYDDLDEVIDYIGARPAPLGAYWFGSDDDELRKFLEFTTSGGVTVNDAIAHGFLPGTPFGGVGQLRDRRLPREGRFRSPLPSPDRRGRDDRCRAVRWSGRPDTRIGRVRGGGRRTDRCGAAGSTDTCRG